MFTKDQPPAADPRNLVDEIKAAICATTNLAELKEIRNKYRADVVRMTKSADEYERTMAIQIINLVPYQQGSFDR